MLFYHLSNLVYWIGKQWKTDVFYHIHHLLLIHCEDIQTLVFKCGARIVTFQVKGSQPNIRFILDLRVYKSQVMQKLTCPLVSYRISFHKYQKSKTKHQKTNFLYPIYVLYDSLNQLAILNIMNHLKVNKVYAWLTNHIGFPLPQQF